MVDCALELQRRFTELRAEHIGNFEGLGLGIGLHSGETVVGNIWSEAVMDYTVSGEVVKIATRLQEEASSCQILLSEDIKEFIPPKGAELLEVVNLPGKS